MTRRTYRSKLELFRDLLVAVRYSSKKTRIMGLANLNPATFRKHMALARAQGLVVVSGTDYCLTERADEVLFALQQLVVKGRELDDGVRFFERSALHRSSDHSAEGAILRHISRFAWGEFQRVGDGGSHSFSRAGGRVTSAAGTRDVPHDPLEILSSLPRARESMTAASRPGRRFPSRSALSEGDPASRDAARARS